MAEATTVEDALPNSPGITSVLPFLYIAWADGLLTPTQIEQVSTRIKEQRWLSEEERRRLCRWLDPKNPPDATTYYGWVPRLADLEDEDAVDLARRQQGVAGGLAEVPEVLDRGGIGGMDLDHLARLQRLHGLARAQHRQGAL